jgi:hypothetical protein
MIESIKKLFTRDKSIELQLIAVIRQQQEFIAKNITERIVYVDPKSGYTNADRFDDPNAVIEKKDDDDEEFEEPQDMSPEELVMQMEGNKAEGEKPNEE